MNKKIWELIIREVIKRIKKGDLGHGKDSVGIREIRRIIEEASHRTLWGVARWATEAERRVRATYPYSVAMRLFGMPQMSEFAGNVLLDEGINELWSLVCGTGGVKFDSSNAYLGVGDSASGEDHTHTGLQASTNKLYKAMMASFPTYGTSQKGTWKSEYTSAEANFDWNEFTVANGNSDSGDNLNRKVSAQGTKASGQTWELTLEITLS